MARSIYSTKVPGFTEISPYDHQKRVWAKLDERFIKRNGKKGLLIVPTGGGKTLSALYWIQRNIVAKDETLIWLADKSTLVLQACLEARTTVPLARTTSRDQVEIGIVGGGQGGWSTLGGPKAPDMVFSTIQSALRNTDQVRSLIEKSSSTLVVFDEAHHSVAHTYLSFLNSIASMTQVKLLGLTATPTRMNESERKRFWNFWGGQEAIIHRVDVATLLKMDILAKSHYEPVPTNVDVADHLSADDWAYLNTKGDIPPKLLKSLAENNMRNKLIADYYAKNAARFDKTIVFACDKIHAEKLNDEFNKAGIKSVFVTDDDSLVSREEKIQEYKTSNDVNVIINVQILTEGFDAPKTKTVFLTRPSRSESLLIQMIGRAMRGPAAKGTSECYIVAFRDNESPIIDWLNPEFLVETGEVEDSIAQDVTQRDTITIAKELIDIAYDLLLENVRGDYDEARKFMPVGWYSWEATYEDDTVQENLVVLNTQLPGYVDLVRDCVNKPFSAADIGIITEKYFGSNAWILPQPGQIGKLLNALANGIKPEYFDFKQKEEFNPHKLANEMIHEDMTMSARRDYLKQAFENPIVKHIYRGDYEKFKQTVDRAETSLQSTKSEMLEEQIIEIERDRVKLRPWAKADESHDLKRILAGLQESKALFPKGAPAVRKVSWTDRFVSSFWGMARPDGTLLINQILNSPDVPVEVLECLVFHELLHYELPYEGHSAEFRRREREHPALTRTNEFLDSFQYFYTFADASDD
jgi:superfamily II DNA or RNA helicase